MSRGIDPFGLLPRKQGTRTANLPLAATRIMASPRKASTALTERHVHGGPSPT